MKLYTVTGDKKLWTNSLDPSALTLIDYPEEAVALFREEARKYLIKNDTKSEWETDYGDESSYHFLHHEIDDGKMLIADGQLVGAIFVTEHYTHAMSNVKDRKFTAVYIEKPNKRKGHRFYERYDIYYNTPSSDTTCTLSIIPREEKPEGYSIYEYSYAGLRNILN